MRVTESTLRRYIRHVLHESDMRQRILARQREMEGFHGAEFPIRGWGKYFDSFHISRKHIGPSFTPRLNVPESPYEDENGYVIEDETTPRFLVAKTITGCFSALMTPPEANWHVYASKVTNTFTPDEKGCPSSPSNPYGPNFSWSDYADHNYFNPNDDVTRQDNIVNCVPDAKKTGEKWVTQETGLPTMMYLGKTISGDKMILSKNVSKRELKQYVVMLDKTGRETM